MTSNLSK